MWEFSEVKLIFFVSTFVKRIIDPRLLPPVRLQPWQNTCMHLPQTLQKLCHNLDHHVYKEVATSLKSITKSFTATVTSHIYFCLGRFIIIYLNYFLLIRFPYLLFFSIISISTTGYSPLYKQITQVHLVQEITTNMKLLVTLPVRHKLLIFFFFIFLLFFLFNVLHFLNF